MTLATFKVSCSDGDRPSIRAATTPWTESGTSSARRSVTPPARRATGPVHDEMARVAKRVGELLAEERVALRALAR